MDREEFFEGWLKRRPIVFAFAVAALPLAITLAFFFDWQSNGLRVERMEADLRARLPLGSGADLAEGWFSSQGIPFSVSDDGAAGRRMNATVRNDSLLECAVIVIDLTFGPDGLLRARSIRRQVYEL